MISKMAREACKLYVFRSTGDLETPEACVREVEVDASGAFEEGVLVEDYERLSEVVG